MSVSGGILAVNPSPVKRTFCFDIPPAWKREIFGRLEGFNYANSEPLVPPDRDRSWPAIDGEDMVLLEVEPFSSMRLPWSECKPPQASENLADGSRESLSEVMVLDGHSLETRTSGSRFLETGFHLMEYDPKNGRIVRLLDKVTHWEVLPGDAEYNLFEPIHEKPDPRYDASRKSYYDRDVDKELRFEACWNPDWKSARNGISEVLDVRIEKGPRSVCLVREYRMEGVSRLIQRFELCVDRPWIEVDIIMHKDRTPTPEAVYFVSQLNLEAGWNAVYDGSGVPIRLDDEQLPGSGRNWLTVEAFTRMEDDRHQFTVFAPGMPLVQIGDFHWGQPKAEIPRPQHPLFLNWACNNYWETNFPTTQEGIIRYRCGLYTSSGARDAEIYRMADGFARQPLLLPLATCLAVESAPLVSIDHPDVRLVSVDRAVHLDGWIFRLVNTGNAPASCGLDLHRPVDSGALVSPVEDIEAECHPEGAVLRFEALPRRVVSVLARF